MIVDAFPTLHVGDNDLWARVVDRDKQDLTEVTVTVRLVDPDGVASAWSAPRSVDLDEAAQGVLRVAPLFTATEEGLGEWRVLVRLVDGAVTSTVSAGFFRVVP